MSDTEKTKKIAITAKDDQGLESRVNAHFGRTPFFVVVTAAGKEVLQTEIVPAGPHSQGGMPQTIQAMGVDVVLTGGMGPNAILRLQAMGIEALTGARGKVAKALNDYLDGKFSGAEACAHPHEGEEDHSHRHPGQNRCGGGGRR